VPVLLGLLSPLHDLIAAAIPLPFLGHNRIIGEAGEENVTIPVNDGLHLRRDG
jgi:hypothetical protein